MPAFSDIATWLANIVWPLAQKVLAGMGVGYLVYSGADTALEAAITAAKNAGSGLPLAVAQIIAKFGFFDYMSITSGGLMGGLAWNYMKKLIVTPPTGGT